MVFVDFPRSRNERPTHAVRAGLTRTKDDARQRTRRGAGPILEIGVTLSVLVVIMISALAVRFLLSLPNGLMD